MQTRPLLTEFLPIWQLARVAQTPTNREKSKNKSKEFEEYNNRNPKNPKSRKFNLKSLRKVGQLLIKSFWEQVGDIYGMGRTCS